MNVVLWVVAGLLALVFLMAGIPKVRRTPQQLEESGMGAVAALGSGAKVIGALEILAAIGLILPPLTGIAPVLAPIAAVGLILLMAGAMVTHLRRGESKSVGMNIVLMLLAAFVAWGRFGPYPFG
ncbi:DoxX family protein [Serinibacter salmoneus]|uniref:DoxX-like protein n=1 Tax=Serinibacter salmoneus TaxID=556530 RepID=A0A2A9D4E0_9MICO|nr:DoxX family protein [Serinibacter salmoneus]PFG21196.1 DoxX-like protein [Serinibacter salmoneus]